MTKKMMTMIYGIISISGGALLSLAGQVISPVVPLLVGLFFLPIVMLTALRQYSLPAASFLWLGSCAVTLLLAPSLGWGVLMAAVWFAGAMILRLGSDVTVDLFSLLFYGGILYLGLILLGAALTVRDVYGVFDFKSAFNAVELPIRDFLTKADALMKEYMLQQQYEQLYAPIMKQAIQNTEGIVYELISFALILFGGWQLFTLKIAQNLCRPLSKRLAAAPLALYGIPREIAWCYLLLFAVSFFLVKSPIYYAFDLALTLTGFLLVPAGVGVVDGFMRKWPAPLRTVMKTLMLVLAFAGYFYGSAITYTVLMAGGLYISLFRQIIFRRIKGGKDDE